jgi:glycosyltransferase involved in cell wall biosynthesis
MSTNQSRTAPPSLSVVIPVYNEEQWIARSVGAIVAAARHAKWSVEVIVVDDGSTDGTYELMESLRGPDVVYVRMRRNAGKSAALSAGLDRVKGEYVVLMDADGQDDPNELPALLEALEGRGAAAGGNGPVDLVTGRRAVRNDRFVKRNTSKLYNKATSVVTGVKGSDFNSGLKVMRRELATGLELYGELHRYIPVLAGRRGFKVGELDVRHHPRQHGVSKYGWDRFYKGLLDLITVLFITKYTRRPLHLFGGLGLLSMSFGLAINLYLAVTWFLGETLSNRPLLLLGVLLMLLGIQLLMTGLIGEMITFKGFQRSDTYSVRELVE